MQPTPYQSNTSDFPSSRRKFLVSLGAAGIVGLSGCLSSDDTDNYNLDESLVATAAAYLDGPVLYTADCHCCEEWAEYVEETTDVTVDVTEVDDLSAIKEEYGVPADLEACHTVDVGDGEYFVEGHVPLEAIGTLVEESPDIAGISLPGMPTGSPGMDGEKEEEFVVYAVHEDESYDEFMRI